MKLYDEVIKRIQDGFRANKDVKNRKLRELPVGESDWRDVSDRSMILRSDMAYELGSGTLPAIGSTIITAEDKLIPRDRIFLIGKDLSELKEDTPYARIALIRVREEALGEGEKLYKAVRDLEHTRYHFYPEGFMMRVSASRNRESVRIGREALAKGLDFTKTGNRMITSFHKHPEVEAVELYYVTDESFDYKELEKNTKEAEEITKTIDHILKNVIMDCKACSLQKVCDEVEGLRELHFAGKTGKVVPSVSEQHG